jgi:hypothetical protein
VRVTETPRRHEQQPQREGVARDDPLQLVRLRVQGLLDARQGDVDDRDVEQGHKPGGEDDRERLPALRSGRYSSRPGDAGRVAAAEATNRGSSISRVVVAITISSQAI